MLAQHATCPICLPFKTCIYYTQDITARIAQEQEYAKLIDTANAPIFGVDLDGLVTVWNKCAANISGYSSEDTMGHHLVNEFITEDFRSSVQEVLSKALRGEEDSNFAFPLVTKDGHRLEILLNATSRRDVDGHIIGVVGIGQDITARIAQEEEYSRLIDTANAPSEDKHFLLKPIVSFACVSLSA